MTCKYGNEIIFNGSIEAAETAITEALQKVGFGVLTRIDVAATLKKKLDLDRPPYLILGACNPKIASHALTMEPDIGLLLPCNVVVYENDAGKTVISVVDAPSMLSVVGRDDLKPVAGQVNELLLQALNACKA
ncbi:MAG TPA: DUF302 domain-containing protein [Mariprofundaceae bacterium]|nr:DUF302 domain-containing protein [Mariprofundaceae bacterium]